MRCSWCGEDPIYVEYHDHVWGRPVKDGRLLFEKLCLDGQQAGLSWITILKKQAGYEAAYAQFEPSVIALFDDQKVEQLMLDPKIVRNRLKIKSIIKNAKAYLDYETQHGAGSFSQFLWQFVDGRTKINQWQTIDEVPNTTSESDAMSKALKKLGFSFVGPTICYAFMQAVGMVNDHLVSCPAYKKCIST